MSAYDLAILGSGPGGYTAALRASMRGAKVCCIEAQQLGGTCLNVGCIPTKAMLHASELFASMARSNDFGIVAGRPELNDAKFMHRVNDVVVGLRKGLGFLLKARKVDVIEGRGRLIDRSTLLVEANDGSKQIKARSIIIATGSRPAKPSFLPWGSDRLMTTDEATTATTLPKSIMIIGGGVVGCEFATMYSELGIATTLVEMQDNLVGNMDQDASKVVAKSLERRKVNVLTGSKVLAVEASSSGVAAELENGSTVEAACALVAVSRTANTDQIGLEELGIELDGSIIRVDERCRTNIDGIYAIGDAAEPRQYAHLASRMGIVAADNATGHDTIDDRKVVPACVYTHPEVATVGLSEAEARNEYRNVRIGRFPYQASGLAHAYGEKEGLVKIIGNSDSDRILGAVIVGQHATDTIQEIVVAMRNKLTVHQLAETIHAHPTFAEAVGEAAESWLGLPLHSMG